MPEKDPLPSLESLDRKLKEARSASQGLQKEQSPGGPLGYAMRIGVELVAGVLAGALVGYALDQWLGTRPWLFLVCFLLGAVAGFVNIYRILMRETDK